jgi:hypothetical protein
MTERDRKADPEHDRARQPSEQDSIIPDRHGKHGGGLESEGSPQEPAPEHTLPKHNGSDRTRH